MKKLFLPVLIFIPLFFSCEKEAAFEDFQREDLIRQIGSSEMDMQVFTYYNTGNIYEFLTRFMYRKYLYDSQNRLERIEIAQSLNPLSCAIIPGTGFEQGDDPRQAPRGQFIEFEYSNDGKIAKRRHYFISDGVENLMNYEIFSYEEDRVVRTDAYNPGDQLTFFFTYHYDNRGNVDQEDYYQVLDGTDNMLLSRTLYEFDTMNNPYRVFSVEGTPGNGTNKNNITRQTILYYYSEEVQTDTLEYEYEYNDLDYPVSANSIEYLYGE